MRVAGLLFVGITLPIVGSQVLAIGGWVNMPLVFALGIALLILAAAAGSLAWMAWQREV
jgi:hypothetical protein